MRKQETTEILDGAGNKVRYSSILLPTDEGFPLQLELLSVAGADVGRFLDALTKADSDQLDLSAIGDSIASVASKIVSVGGNVMVARILKYTKRERTPGSGADDMLDLGTPFGRDCYAGNYGELIRALVWVLTINYAPFLTERLKQGQGLLEILNGLFQGGNVTI